MDGSGSSVDAAYHLEGQGTGKEDSYRAQILFRCPFE